MPAAAYRRINWSHGARAVRDLAVIIFGRQMLATSSLTGTISKIFADRGVTAKPALDPVKVREMCGEL